MKKILICLLSLMILVGCTNTNTGFNLKAKEKSVEAEYLSVFNPLENVEADEGVELKAINEVKTDKLGVQNVVIEGTKDSTTKKVTYELKVIGVVALQPKVTVLAGQNYDLKSNFEANIEYEIETNADLATPGTYKVQAVHGEANEENGNVKAEYELLVVEDEGQDITGANQGCDNCGNQQENTGNNQENTGNTGNTGTTPAPQPEPSPAPQPAPEVKKNQQVDDLFTVIGKNRTLKEGTNASEGWQYNYSKLKDCSVSFYSDNTNGNGTHTITLKAVDANNNYQFDTYIVSFINCDAKWVVDSPAYDEEVWVVDEPGKDAVYETVKDYRWTAYFYDNRNDQNLLYQESKLKSEMGSADAFLAWMKDMAHSIEGCTWSRYEEDVITEQKLVSEAVSEKGHYETVHHEEVGHWEYPEGC